VETPRLVASDVDGTLLGPREDVTTRTAGAVARVIASGTPFVLVTGRPPRWVPRVAEAVGARGWAVCANGAVLYDIGPDRVRRTYQLDPALLSDVVHTVTWLLPDCTLAVERVGESAFALDGHEFLTDEGYRHPWPGDDSRTAARAELVGYPAVKLLVRQPGMTSDELAASVGSIVGDAVDVTFSTGFGLIEISAPGISKATGLAEIADLLGVPAEASVAFGDMPNDVPMLRWAGHGVAVANAHPAVLAAADEITAANSDDGVAQVLERWF
jgi:hypothetical protein